MQSPHDVAVNCLPSALRDLPILDCINKNVYLIRSLSISNKTIIECFYGTNLICDWKNIYWSPKGRSFWYISFCDELRNFDLGTFLLYVQNICTSEEVSKTDEWSYIQEGLQEHVYCFGYTYYPIGTYFSVYSSLELVRRTTFWILTFIIIPLGRAATED